MSDLFGNPVIPDGPAMTPQERKRMLRRAAEVPNGYYAPPGTGPDGETCKSCRFASAVRMSKTYWKCARRGHWTTSYGSDIRLKSPACRGWERKEA